MVTKSVEHLYGQYEAGVSAQAFYEVLLYETTKITIDYELSAL